MKAYLVFYAFLLVHQLACLAVGAWVLDEKNPYHHTNWPASAVGLAGLNLYVTCSLSFAYWKNLAFHNRLEEETRAPVRTYRTEDGDYEWMTKDASSSPYTLDVKNNFRFVLGPWWSFPLFWTYSPVKDACLLKIFEMKQLKMALSPSSGVSIETILPSDADIPRSRRRTSQSATTGFEETPLPLTTASSPDLSLPAVTATRRVRPYTDPF